VRKLSTYGLIALCLGTSAIVAKSNRSVAASANQQAGFAANGAFRDGLFVGKLAAEGGQPLRPTVGRWSTDRDRSMFAAGYRRGYEESFANHRNKPQN
jgi:hypothetical protein